MPGYPLDKIIDINLRKRLAEAAARQAGDSRAKTVTKLSGKGPNHGEVEALDLLGLSDWVASGQVSFEGHTFDLGAHSYTPDWFGSWHSGRPFCMEVKAEYIHSRDSRILFDMARQQHPEFVWVWARKRTKGRKGRRWEIEVYE